MSNVYVQVAAKHLSSVEVNSWNSNQHEFNGVQSLKDIFGYSRISTTARFEYLSSLPYPISENVNITWYDARENHPIRSEYRLYYESNSIVHRANVNDLLIIAKHSNGTLLFRIIDRNSAYYLPFLSLLGMHVPTNSYVFANNIAI